MHEVLIKIKATSVTASDVLIRSLDEPLISRFILQIIFGFGKPRNPILGMVSSGVVVAKGEKGTSVRIVQEVFAYGSISTTKRRFPTISKV